MAETYRTNLPHIAQAYIHALGVPVTKSTLKKSLEENPFFPSLYSLSSTLDRFHIGHTAFRVDKEKLDELATPFIAYMEKQSTGKDFVTVTTVNSDMVTFIAGSRKPQKISREEFITIWQGIVLQARPDPKSGESDYAIKRKAEKNHIFKRNALLAAATFVMCSAIWMFLNALPSSSVFSASVLLLIKLTGLAAAVLLLIYEIDKSNAFIKNICTAGKQTNCDAVLRSSASKVLGMSWSEVGFFYFAGSLLFLLLPGINFAAKATILAMANLLAVPYVVFSIYYQWKVVKQWCPLCLTVQAVLMAEFIWSMANVWAGSMVLPAVAVIASAAWSLAIPVILWYALKPVISAAKEAPDYKAAYKRLLYNPDTFQNLLQQQPLAPAGYEHLGITVGNPDGEHTIIKVCNPYCGPCAKAHPVLDEIVHHNKNVKLKLIFTASNDEGDIRGVAARHLMAISKNQHELTERALDDWYLAEKKDYASFAAKYPLNGEIKEQEEIIDKMKQWCDKAEIAFTPTIYVNGYRLPEKYKIDELKYIL